MGQDYTSTRMSFIPAKTRMCATALTVLMALGCAESDLPSEGAALAGLSTPEPALSAVATAPRSPEGPPPPARPESAALTVGGVAFERVRPGTGDRPGSDDAVRIHYTGWAQDGSIFANTPQRGRAATFRVRDLIPGLAEALQDMRTGEQRRLWVPSEQAYAGHSGMPRGDLSYEVELLEVLTAPPAPVDVAGPPRGVELSSSGLAWKRLASGQGDRRPGPGDTVSLHTSIWTTDGVLVDSTRLRDHPLTIGVVRTMPGLAEALETMLPRERRRLWVPEALAYRGRPGAPAGMLVVDVELLELVELPAAPPAQASAAAVTTTSGLASELLEAGTGSRHPGPDSLVTVHFTGWTASGELHDSSLSRGQPTTVRVSELIPGWQEGLQLMVEGESRRLWLPAELAFAGKPDKPVGPMVYDLELLAISD